eukprot:3526318-Pleurochrysis_carterae.AAC.1
MLRTPRQGGAVCAVLRAVRAQRASERAHPNAASLRCIAPPPASRALRKHCRQPCAAFSWHSLFLFALCRNLSRRLSRA